MSNKVTKELILQEFLQCRLPPQWSSIKQVQKVEENLTWNDVFKIVKSKHWHREGKSTSPHEESLWEHSLSCADVCFDHGKSSFFYLLGLLHDVGKIGTQVVQGKYVSFKGHSIVGGAFLQCAWHSDLERFMTRQDWDILCASVDLHMCGYFSGCALDCGSINMDMFRFVHTDVQRALSVLRIGDSLGRSPQELSILSTVETFNQNVTTPLNMEEFARTHGFRGVIIFLQGYSGSGKSSLAKFLTSNLKCRPDGKCKIVSRDVYMVYYTLKYTRDVEMKKKWKEQRKLSIEELEQVITAEMYNDCYTYYNNVDKIYSETINRRMQNDIANVILRNGIVVVDTLATCYIQSAIRIIPDCCQNALRISLWPVRNTPFTDEEVAGRLGCSLNTQLKIAGDITFENRLRDLYFHDLVSLTELNNSTYKFQPHLSLTIGWNNTLTVLRDICKKLTELDNVMSSFSRPLVLEETMNMNLEQLILNLYSSGGYSFIEGFFKQYNYLITKMNDNVFGIKYIDGINNIWKPKWAREARGRFYYCDGKTVLCLKETLQRGVELLTKAHTDAQITETQDVSEFSEFDDRQAKLLQAFSGEAPIQGFLSSKVDGSLLIISYYPKNSPHYNVMKGLIETSSSDVLYVEGNDGLIVPATQGTLFMGDVMFDYFLTSISSVAQIPVELLEKKTNPKAVWNTICENFYNWMMKQIRLVFPMGEKVCYFAYESVCANRTTYMGTLHTELAVNYPNSFVSFLGMYCNSKYVPHFDLPLIEEFVGHHPLAIRVSSTTEVFQHLKALEESVIRGDCETDAEGFVYLDLETPSSRLSETPLSPLAGEGEYDYSKIKTTMYYMCHKIREKNLPYLESLPEHVAKRYPVLRRVNGFTSTLESKLLLSLQHMLTRAHEMARKNSLAYNTAPVKAQKYFVDSNETPPDSVIRIVLNTSDSVTKYICQDTSEVFGTSVDLVDIMKALFLRLKKFNLEEIQVLVKSVITNKEDVTTKKLFSRLFD